MNPSVAAQFDVVEIAGRHPFVVLPPFEGLDVVRRGFRTQLRTGTVEAVDVTVIVKARNGDRHRVGPIGVRDSLSGTSRSAPWGDSGSLVVDAAGGAARGLVFASSETSGGITWACDLRTVMNISRARHFMYRLTKRVDRPCDVPPAERQVGRGVQPAEPEAPATRSWEN